MSVKTLYRSGMKAVTKAMRPSAPARPTKVHHGGETAFDKAQTALDASLRAVHEALSQKDMDKATRHAATAQKHFDRLFKRQRKAS
jgi:hypothetical protein